MSDQDENLPAERADDLPAEAASEPIPDPGLPAHRPRPTDVDEQAAKRAERQIATLLRARRWSAWCCSSSPTSPSRSVTTPTPSWASAPRTSPWAPASACALLFIGIGVIQWARKLMGDHEIVEMRHPVASSAEDREATLGRAGPGRRGVRHRPPPAGPQHPARRARPASAWPRSSRCATSGRPPTRSPTAASPARGSSNTVWDQGHAGRPRRRGHADPGLRARDRRPGQRAAGGGLQRRRGRRAAGGRGAPDRQVQGVGDRGPDGARRHHPWPGPRGLVGRRDPLLLQDLHPRRAARSPCTSGTTHHLLCPCHQSTFDLADNAKVIFGPAARPLPQLPLAVDAEGYLVAQSDFTEPVGPSFWERDSA